MSFKEFTNFQPKVINQLLNSYKKNRLAHAYLFEGEKGTQKKAIALEFAKLLYCEGEEKPCDTCINCLRIEHMNHPNVLIIEAENNSIKKEQILYLQDEYSKTNLEVGPKVYIIEGIEKMSINAANSILKFIEEPQPNTYTILITDNLHQILPTIISRCQVINFQPIPHEEIEKYLLSAGMDPNVSSICSHLTNDLDQALLIAQDEMIHDVIDLVTTLMRSWLSQSENLVVVCENSSVDLYNDKKTLSYFLDILLLFIRDINHVFYKKEKIVFKEQFTFIQQHLLRITKEKVNKNIDWVLKAKISLDYNANSLLLIDHLLINLI